MSSSGEVIPAYLAHLETEGYAAATLEATRRWLEQLVHHAGDLAELRPAELTAFEQSLRWQPNKRGQMYSENSVNQAIDVVRCFYRWAAAVGHIAKDPTTHMITRRVPTRPKSELTTADARKLMAQPDLTTFRGCRDRAILGLIIEHQLPFQGLANLDLNHFQYDTGAIMVSGRKRGIVSLSEGLADDLQRYLTEGRPGVAKVENLALFVSDKGSRMTGTSFRVILDRHAKRAGLPKVPFSS